MVRSSRCVPAAAAVEQNSTLPQVIVAIPELPGFAGDVKDEMGLKAIMGAQYRSINRGGSSIYEKIRAAGYEP